MVDRCCTGPPKFNHLSLFAQSFETIAYSGLPGTGVVWTVGSGTLTVDSGVPFFAGEKIIILVQ